MAGGGHDPDRRIIALRALPWALAFGAPLGMLIGLGLGGLVGGILGAPLGAGFVLLVVRLATDGAAHIVRRTLEPSGSTTPYRHDFSVIDAHVVRGEHDAAAQLWDDAVAERPGEVEVRVRAADFFGDIAKQPARALALYREADRLGPPPERALYIAQRTIDLLLGPAGDRGRAKVELRRLIDRWPQSAAARHARDALARIKAEDDAER